VQDHHGAAAQPQGGALRLARQLPAQAGRQVRAHAPQAAAEKTQRRRRRRRVQQAEDLRDHAGEWDAAGRPARQHPAEVRAGGGGAGARGARDGAHGPEQPAAHGAVPGPGPGAAPRVVRQLARVRAHSAAQRGRREAAHAQQSVSLSHRGVQPRV